MWKQWGTHYLAFLSEFSLYSKPAQMHLIPVNCFPHKAWLAGLSVPVLVREGERFINQSINYFNELAHAFVGLQVQNMQSGPVAGDPGKRCSPIPKAICWRNSCLAAFWFQ